MATRGNHILLLVAVLALCAVMACGEDPPPAPRPHPVQTTSARKANVKSAPLISHAADELRVGDSKASQELNAAAGSGTGVPQLAGEYDPQGRFDPFEPLFKEQPAALTATRGRHNRRTPQTPLEQVAIGQLKLTAIMRMPVGDRAIVEDITGKGYVIKKGTYVGINSGKVTQIGKGRVVIEEVIEDMMGERIIQSTELKLRKPVGEL